MHSLVMLVPLVMSFFQPTVNPLLNCRGAAFQADVNDYAFTATIGWDGYVCGVEVETIDGVQTFTENSLGEYTVVGFGTDTVYASSCWWCSPIKYIRVYYNDVTSVVFMPMLLSSSE